MTNPFFLNTLKVSDITIGDKNVEVRLGNHRGIFPLTESMPLTEDTLVLLELSADYKKIVAIDAVHLGHDHPLLARLFGKPKKKLDLFRQERLEVNIRFDFYRIPRQIRRYKIDVAEYDGEILFHSDGVYFDILHADYEFEFGQLSIKRDGKLFDRTRSIREYGTHGACTCFLGLSKLWPNADYEQPTSSLIPEQFKIGDILTLDVPGLEWATFGDYIRRNALGHAAIIATLKEKSDQQTTIQELGKQFVRKLPELSGQFAKTPVVRFREKKSVS